MRAWLGRPWERSAHHHIGIFNIVGDDPSPVADWLPALVNDPHILVLDEATSADRRSREPKEQGGVSRPPAMRAKTVGVATRERTTEIERAPMTAMARGFSMSHRRDYPLVAITPRSSFWGRARPSRPSARADRG